MLMFAKRFSLYSNAFHKILKLLSAKINEVSWQQNNCKYWMGALILLLHG